MDTLNLNGIIPAVILPMRQDYSIDFGAYRRYLEWVMAQGPVGLAVNVDTGEGPYLTLEERREVIRVSRQVAADRCFIVAGVGGPSTNNAIANAKAAREAGADALLVFPTPAFLNDPLDPRIMVDYHRAIAEASGLPLIVFQLGPIFGGVNYPPHALAEVLRIPQVIGLKDASFDAQHFVLTRDVIGAADHPITLLTGNDNFLLESFLLGAEGGLLGYGAVGVGLLVGMHQAVTQKDFAQAAAMQKRVQGFCDYIYGRPIGDYRARCKVALVHMGLLKAEQTYVRPPYLSLWEVEQEAAYQAVEKAGLLARAAV
ncbi:MAG TPA: dihydrodipicolinate synthase family protein [Anaerolineae bacterium]|nr:dihydrodipicolinate synthase family protein [Anaerolineae bacterium]HXV97738.1 dihydrodipicolinate synthase family protein [Anaerolineae bacterium]